MAAEEGAAGPLSMLRKMLNTVSVVGPAILQRTSPSGARGNPAV